MRKQRGPSYLALLPALLLIGGCEREAEPAEPTAVATRVDASDPLAAIPREAMYGPSAVENLWSPRVELEVLDLPRGWDGARVAIVSDFQLGRWEENEEVAAAAIELAVREDVDLVVLLGDFLVEGDAAAALQRVLAPLRNRRAAAVLGSRDVRSDSAEALVTRVLQGAGVHVLKNETVLIEIGGDSARVAGLDPGIARMSWGDQQWILASLGEVGRTPLLLTQMPALVTRAPQGRYPIAIGGNVFCGSVEVSGTPRFAWLRDEVFPFAGIEGTERLFRVQGSTVLISCGIGYGFIPLRFGAAPEVPILTLRRFAAQGSARVDDNTSAEALLDEFQQPATPPDPGP